MWGPVMVNLDYQSDENKKDIREAHFWVCL
jgi:hypothetical protein